MIDKPVRATAKLKAALRARKFVRAFLAGPEDVRGNAAQCAIIAGYRPGTAQSASVEGARQLANPYVRRLLARHLECEELTTQRIFHELASVALAQISDVIEWDATGARLRASSKVLDDDTLAAVQEVEHGPRVRVRMHDKVRALEVLLRAKRAIGDDVPHEFTLIIGRSGPVQVNAGPGGEGDGAPARLTLRLGAPPPGSGNGDEVPPPDAERPDG